MLREELVKLAHRVPETRVYLVPLLKVAWGGSTSDYSPQLDKVAAEIQKQTGIKEAVVGDTWMESSDPPVVWAMIEIYPDIEDLVSRTSKPGVAATVAFKKAVKAVLSRFRNIELEKSSTPRQNFPDRLPSQDPRKALPLAVGMRTLFDFYKKNPYRIEILYYPLFKG